ncbi:Pyridoxamine 5'-phosphate oxidase family protein [Sulfidibacter corallicola]|uniref:Pyridoxamine 5'-phosphate oxidase family protein n=1 Tax=Sulfidibacter corallicola TaxID=2818388 RepID=A0A8A4TNY1_SULCO|nr:pyridoxamine 5'-phosphate oxidase family protein [Sulfidibacter corallicola]QTD51679.1 pyridoxamine 5'-phosphate oxidase family protein [Sulfidibacter corallicola]
MTEPESTPFHEGERAIQERYGIHEQLAKRGRRMIRPYMPDQHRDFYSKLPFLIVGSTDQAGNPWASIVAGPPGFAQTPDATRLQVSAQPLPGDPLATHLKPGASVGMLGLEPHTRRRNRLNGKIERTANGAAPGFRVQVDQTFGNCPKFIVPREAIFQPLDPETAPKISHFERLDSDAQRLISEADTFFIASAHEAPNLHASDTLTIDRSAYGVDVSHRGGDPGFVTLAGDGAFHYPDYRGNQHFNTLGNLVCNPKSGYLFVDFSSGRILMLTGTSSIEWDQGGTGFPAGAERMLRFELTRGICIENALPLRWAPPKPKPTKR